MPRRPDLALAAVLLVAAELQVAFATDLHGARWAIAVLALPTAAIAWGRAHALAVVVVMAVCEAAGNLAVYGTRPSEFVVGAVVALVAAVYLAGAYEPRRGPSAAGLLIMLVAFWLNDLREGNPATELLASATLTVGPWTAGRLVARARRQTAALAAANAELVEQRTRAREVAAAAEREHIARELHDIVAHSLSVIAVQADAAEALIASRPDDASRAVAAVRRTARDALQEMRRLLGHLREEDVPATLRELERLVADARHAGAEVALDVRGVPTTLPPAVDVSAYRIVQEGLTNARRHAPGAACAVTIGYAEDALAISVRNDAGRAAAANGAPGYGLVGVRERIDALGGALDVGPAESGGWRLDVRLPLA